MELSEKEIKETLGHRITMLRTLHKLSQKEFAEKINCMVRRLGAWETGQNLAPTNFLIEIAKKFSISMDFFNPYDENFMIYLAKKSSKEVVSQENTTSQA